LGGEVPLNGLFEVSGEAITYGFPWSRRLTILRHENSVDSTISAINIKEF